MKKCVFCSTMCEDNHNFCYNCGGSFEDANPEELLGVTITDEDIKDYVIQGKVTKVVKIGEAVTAEIRTLTSGEWKQANQAAEQYANIAPLSRNVTQNIELVQRIAAYGLRGINGNSKIAEYTPEQRYEYIQTMSSDFVEIIASKIQYLHKIMMKKIQEGQIKNF